MGETILEADDKPPKKEPSERAIVEDAIKKAEVDLEAVKEIHDRAREVLEFAYAEDQWDTKIKEDRKGRPCLTINKLPANADKVEGELRQNKISIKVIPWNGRATQADADVRAGVIRNIEEISDAEYHYVTAGTNAATTCKGVLRAYTRYTDDDTFDQELRVMAIENPLSVVFDSEAKMADKSDANHAFVFDSITRSEYKRRWKGKTPVEFSTDTPKGLESWAKEDEVAIAEYFLKVPTKETLYQIKDAEGNVDIVKEVPEGAEVLDERKLDHFKIEWRLIDGQNVLEGPIEWPGRKYIPLVEVPGKKVNIDGKVKQRGMFNYSIDPQKNYNYSTSSYTETVALAPKSPWLVTGEMVKGYEKIWKEAHAKNFPYLPFNIDPKNPNATPQRQQPGAMPLGMLEERRLAGDEIKDTIGRHEASLGMRSNETSGAAIDARAARSELGDFTYPDNLKRGVRQLGRVLMDAMPRVYDTERLIRIVKDDESEEMVVLNKKIEDGILRDMSAGRYEVKVSVGLHYDSKQAEALDGMMQTLQYSPQTAPMMMDLIAEASTWPNKEKIIKRFKPKEEEDQAQMQQMVQQQAQQMTQQAIEQYKQGPEAQKAMAETKEAEVALQIKQTEAQEAVIQLEIKKAELAKKKQEVLGAVNKRMTGA